MATITISLPNQIVKTIDVEAKNQGFATRSEFIRSLLRRYLGGGETRFEAFTSQSLEQIKFELTKTGKYSEKFINSVIRGLAKSSVYENEAPSA